MSDAGYFLHSLGTFIEEVGACDPDLFDQALNSYVNGGLMAGISSVGFELMARGRR